MILHSSPADQAKGWLVGPWNSAVLLPVGYANDYFHFVVQTPFVPGDKIAVIEKSEEV